MTSVYILKVANILQYTKRYIGGRSCTCPLNNWIWLLVLRLVLVQKVKLIAISRYCQQSAESIISVSKMNKSFTECPQNTTDILTTLSYSWRKQKLAIFNYFFRRYSTVFFCSFCLIQSIINSLKNLNKNAKNQLVTRPYKSLSLKNLMHLLKTNWHKVRK